MVMRQAMATTLGRSPIIKVAIIASRTMAASTGMGIMETMTDDPRHFRVGENGFRVAVER
ncbi:MAG: hypothetical protein DM484_31010 [Candidatus Methylumidiphilus alinenensis]|uniref:Uncharacterized protein n=1 Tax=Candidatus Methylumidiphilus alinenensis TaxID=2202197 RepID=A0A2W4Q8B1_9GAMM|nr:MAG: hypothetical protein DM484_31010 [Candidatus Methylumidiphilus alinenensis]